MQLQPFRRPNIIDAETTRDAIVRHLAEIRELYAQRNRTLFACDAASNSDAHLRPSDFIATFAEPPKPKPGDIHDWDKLVDGCLYIDVDALGDPILCPFLVVYRGAAQWADIDHDHLDTEAKWFTESMAQKSGKATVVAVGLDSINDFRNAMRDYREGQSKSGGVK